MSIIDPAELTRLYHQGYRGRNLAVALGLKSSQESTVRLHIKKLGLADQESDPQAGAPASISVDGEYRQRQGLGRNR